MGTHPRLPFSKCFHVLDEYVVIRVRADRQSPELGKAGSTSLPSCTAAWSRLSTSELSIDSASLEDEDVWPIVDLWLDFHNHLSDETVPYPQGLLRERRDIARCALLPVSCIPE